MNCAILSAEQGASVNGWIFSGDQVVPEILNCQFSTLAIGLFAGGTARLRNSVMGHAFVGIENRGTVPGTLAIDRCAFWLPEPAYNHWTDNLRLYSPIRITADRSFFVSGTFLASGAFPTWTGEGNVYMKPYGFQGGGGSASLEQIQAQFKTDLDSIELPPWEFDPAQWRILRDKSPGYEPRPDGKDYGADIDRLVNAIGAIAAHKGTSPPQ